MHKACTRLAAAAMLATACFAALAHDVPIDWSGECMPPGGAAVQAQRSSRFDAATGSYLFTATDDRGAVTYRVRPGEGSGANGLFSVDCSMDGADEFTITRGVMLAARDAAGQEVAHDGTLRIGAFDSLDLDADGPGGYMPEPTGHGPCIRLGDTLPVAPHTTGFVTLPLDVPAGPYFIGVRYMDDADDRADDSYIRLSVDGAAIGEWSLTRNDDQWREQLFAADVAGGSVLRIDSRTDDTGGVGSDFCRISHILIRPAADRGLQLRHSLEDGTLTIAQASGLAPGVPPVTATIALTGRVLRCHLAQTEPATSPAGLTGLALLPSDDTPEARILKVPYVEERVVVNGDAGFFATFIDRFLSHCTRLRPAGLVDEQTGVAGVFGELLYYPNSAAEFYEFDETLYIAASPRLLDLTPTFPARRPTSGRAELGKRVVFDHWRMATGDDFERQMRIMDGCGMHDLLAILHTWMRYGYDRKQPQFVPASPDKWTGEQFTSAIAATRELGWRAAVHENYNHMDWDSPYNSPTPATEFGEPVRPGDPGPEEAAALVTSDPGEDLSRQPRNAWAFARLADLRVAPGPLSRPQPPAFPISSDKMLFYSQIESHKIREMYGTTAGYLDVSPCVQPGLGTWDLHIDLDARNREARGFDQVYRNAARQFAHHRDIFEIATGEGGANASYHAGYIHAVERQIRTRMNTPIIPHFELATIRPLSLHHGMGYYSRYFDKESDSSTWDWDRYRAMQIVFGHAGFMGDNIFRGTVPTGEAIRHYYTMRALQEAYADAELVAIEYEDGGEWITVEQGLARDYDFTRARIRVSYANGLQVAANFDDRGSWPVQLGDQRFALPGLGYAAVCEARGLVVKFAFGSGTVEDYAKCPEYEYRHLRQSSGQEPFTHHVVTRPAGLPGLSERPAPGMLICLNDDPREVNMRVPADLAPDGRLNLTIVNSGDAVQLPLNIEGVDVAGAIPTITYRGTARNRTGMSLAWTPPGAGEWTVAFACTYTDPSHMDETANVPIELLLEGARVTVAADGPETPTLVTAAAKRSANFVEVAAELSYPQLARPGQELRFTFDALQLGQTVDDDFARDVRLIMTNAATGERLELAFPESGDVARSVTDGMNAVHDFPALSVTTFEIGL